MGRMIVMTNKVSSTQERAELWDPVHPGSAGYDDMTHPQLVSVKIDASGEAWGGTVLFPDCEPEPFGPFPWALYAWDADGTKSVPTASVRHEEIVGTPGLASSNDTMEGAHSNIKEAARTLQYEKILFLLPYGLRVSHVAVLRLVACVLGKRLRGKTLYVRSDNTATVALIAKTFRCVPPGTSRFASRTMADIGMQLRLWEQRLRTVVTGQHIVGDENWYADSISRMVLREQDFDPHPDRFMTFGTGGTVMAACRRGFNMEAFGPRDGGRGTFIEKYKVLVTCTCRKDFFDNAADLLSNPMYRIWAFPPLELSRELLKIAYNFFGPKTDDTRNRAAICILIREDWKLRYNFRVAA